ncbi:MAG: hypothetical protein J5654_06360 [Victivallales bacterium]|nr:hypothetical protein [Victivallales bacterium]
MTTHPATTYRCGTLTYTLPRLFFVLFWVVIGSAVIAVGTQLPSIMLPVQLKELGVSETAKVFLLTTIGQVLNMTVCPYIGVVSDWHRGKWGRRIPYIFLSMPPIVLSLVMFGLSGQLGNRLAAWTGAAPVTMTVVAIGLAMFLFQFFNMWVNSVIWYIFNDIIPVKFFGAAMAAFKIGLTAGPSLFHYFLFKYVATHPTLLYLGVALLYLVGVSFFCLFVKEGEYPPLTEEQLAEQTRPWRERLLGKWKGLGVFVKESFCGRIYLYRYCFTICVACAGCAGVFSLYMFQRMGLTDNLIGKMNGLVGIIGTVGILVVSVLLAEVVNRWHPLRVELYYYFYVAITLPLCLRWLFGVIPPQVYAGVSVAGSIFGLCLTGMFQICSLPSLMVLFPKSRFGSFCSMQALLRSTCFMLMSIVAGGVFDLLKAHYADKGDANFAYLYASPWPMPWYLLAVLFGYLLYREWGRNGGLKNYAAPASWEKSGHEVMESLSVRPVSPSALRRSLPCIDAVFLLFTILLPLYALWHCRWRTAGEPGLLRQYLVAPTILALVGDAIWIALRIRLVRRLRRILDGTEENCGLLHPGMVLVVLATYTAGILTTLYSNIFATGVLGYATNIMVACTLVCLAIALTLLARLEHGIPQPPELSPSN